MLSWLPLSSSPLLEYSNAQKNNAKISTVKQVVNLIRLYKAENEEYPRSGGGTWCLTQDNACTGYSGTASSTDNTALMNELKRYGSPAASAGDKVETGTRYGIQYLHASARTLDSQTNPVLILFWLEVLIRCVQVPLAA